MGVVFLEHMGGQKPYDCAKCKANLSNLEQMNSQRFCRSAGTLYVFDKVVNVTKSETKECEMYYGRQIYRTVFCKRCESRLGWYNEFLFNESERYMEGKYVLLKSVLTEGKAV